MRLLHVADGDGRAVIGLHLPDGRVIDIRQAHQQQLPDDEHLPTTIDGLLREDRLATIANAVFDDGRDFELNVDEDQLMSPILAPQKIIGVGMNYASHATETGTDMPPEPVFFAKFPNTIIGPRDTIKLPPVSQEVDWEAELVVVIGRRGRAIAEQDAMAHVAGYMVGNDVSARDWQLRKPLRQWTIGKTFDTFLPLGPYLITADEVPDPHGLHITCSLNGERVQDDLTNLHFRIPMLISYLSRVMTLEPGDLILTGTPAGVGMSRTPPRYLHDGDVLETSIAPFGVLRNPVRRIA